MFLSSIENIIELDALLCKQSLSNFGKEVQFKVLDLTYKILYVLGPSPLQNYFFRVELPWPITSSREKILETSHFRKRGGEMGKLGGNQNCYVS